MNLVGKSPSAVRDDRLSSMEALASIRSSCFISPEALSNSLANLICESCRVVSNEPSRES